MTRFSRFAVVDWSGAVGPRQAGIAIAVCESGDAAPALVRPGHVWSRTEVLSWLQHDVSGDMLVGFDLSPGLPFVDAGAYFPEWPESPKDARALWALVERLSADDPHLGVSSFVDHPDASRYFRRHGGRTGDRFGTGAGRLRQVEHRQRDCRLSPYSCFNLIGAAQVGKSSLTAMRLFHRLDGRLPIWPFDDAGCSGPLIVEIYTSLAARAAGLRKGLSKLRDRAALDAALAQLGSDPHTPLQHYTDHATDAILTSAWLRTVAHDDRLWSPAGLTEVAATEGWTFGVA